MISLWICKQINEQIWILFKNPSNNFNVVLKHVIFFYPNTVRDVTEKKEIKFMIYNDYRGYTL